MSAYRFSVLVLILSALLAYLYSDQLQLLLSSSSFLTVRKFIPVQLQSFFESGQNTQDVEQEKKKPQIFTKEELWRDYRGTEGSKGLYLAFFGKVYDVSKGKQYYAPGGGYDFFAGRDGTKGFVTGDFTEAGLVDDLDGLDATLFQGFEEWLDFYEKTYTFVGYVVGNFYDEAGNPTAALNRAQDMIEKAKKEQERNKEHQRKFPMCNSESSAAKGARVWCSKRSGGIQRDWVGVPRMYHYPGTTTLRCACVRTTGPPSDGKDTGANRGDLDNPNLKEYPNCSPKSESCIVSTPK